MRCRVIGLGLIVVLAACSPMRQEQLTREAARTVVRPVVAENFPGIPLDPAVDCVIDNASGNELLTLAADAVTGPTASTVEVVSNIAARPATLTCLAERGLPALLGMTL